MPASNFSLKNQLSARTLTRKLCLVGGFAILSLSLSGCGKKGPLYLPDPDEQAQTETATQSTKNSQQETQ